MEPTHMALGTSLRASRTRSGTQCSSSLHPFQNGTWWGRQDSGVMLCALAVSRRLQGVLDIL